MKFQINALSGRVICEVEIEADGRTSERVKLGRATLAAVAAKVDLTGAYLRGADLTGAYLGGAYLRGDPDSKQKDEIESMVAQIVRTYDGYYFFGFRLSDGTLRIVAGCRYFTPEEYRAHIAEEYPSGTKAEETLAILDFIEARAAKLAPIAKAAT